MKVLAQIPDPISYITGWFHRAPLNTLCRDNLSEFLSWAFFDLSSAPTPSSPEGQELRRYIDLVEKHSGHILPEGYNANIKSQRLTIDPVRMSHRSLLWYSIVLFVDFITSIRLHLRGFKAYPSPAWFDSFPFRPHTAVLSWGRSSPVKELSYWLRPHKIGKSAVAVVFLHGLGIGLHPYISFINEIADGVGEDVGVVVLEIMNISMRVSRDTLSPAKFSRHLQEILDFHGIDEFVLVSHSYGSVLATNLLHCPAMGPRVASLVFIDPIAFLLHLPAVAYNFTSRPPITANHHQTHYFAAMDPGIAHTVCRHFFWADNILWKEELAGRRVCVVISAEDLLVEAGSVWQYLTDTAAPDQVKGKVWRRQGKEEEDLTVMWYDCDHAQVFHTRERRKDVVDIVARFSRLGGKE